MGVYMTMIYRYPGDMITLEDGRRYDFKVIGDDAGLEHGWHFTYCDARDSYEAAKHIDDDYAPPTEGDDLEAKDPLAPRHIDRGELEVKAKELGIGYNSRTSDDKLLQRINEKLSQ